MTQLPFDPQEATRSIVRVMRGSKRSGCGFVALDEYVITVAHCLPRIPRRHFDDQFATIRSWDGSDEAHLPIIHCDLMSDIAILWNDPKFPWYEAFDRIVERTGSARVDLRFPVKPLPLRFYIRTHKGAWLTGATDRMFILSPMFSAPIDEGGEVPGGTSGSPVFNQKGEVIGLVSSGGTSNLDMVWLAGALQGSLIGEFKGTGRSHEQIEALLRAEGILMRHLAHRGLSGTARATRSLLRRRLAGAKRIEAVLKPEAAAALVDLRQRTGSTYSAIIEAALVAASKR